MHCRTAADWQLQSREYLEISRKAEGPCHKQQCQFKPGCNMTDLRTEPLLEYIPQLWLWGSSDPSSSPLRPLLKSNALTKHTDVLRLHHFRVLIGFPNLFVMGLREYKLHNFWWKKFSNVNSLLLFQGGEKACIWGSFLAAGTISILDLAFNDMSMWE